MSDTAAVLRCALTPSFTFRLATRNDTANLVSLLNETFRTQIDAQTWEWFVYGNPYGEGRVYIAEDLESSVAGVFAFTPVRMRLQGQLVTARHGHHLAIKQAYRGGIVFVALSRHALTVEAAHGTQLIIGLLNKHSYRPQKVLMKWSDFGFLDCLYKLSPSSRKHSCREVQSVGVDFDRFYSRVSNRLDFHCEKTAEWVNWRFCSRPGAPYRVYVIDKDGSLEGYIVLKRWREADGYRKAHIIDFHAANEAALAELMSAAESYATDCNELNLWTIQGYPYRNFLENVGFQVHGSGPQPLAARTLDGSPITFPAGSASFSYGDGDTVY